MSDGVAAVSPEQRKVLIQQALSQLEAMAAPELMTRGLLAGGAVGAGLVGLKALGKVAKRSKPMPFTYTMPVDIPVYRPHVESKKKRRVGAKTANLISDVATVTNQPGDLAKYVAATLVGGAGAYAASNRLLQAAQAMARRRQLAAARLDYEQALKEVSSGTDTDDRRKVAADPQMTRLAENCVKLAGWLETMQGWLPYMALAAGGTGAYLGYSHGQANSKRRALEFAERRANMDREARNPTFPVATLEAPSAKDEAELEEQARRQVLESLVEEYPYL